MKLSIIVPVYNVEKYIAKCLHSLLDQDLSKSEYEIIVVNDGTKDRSAQIAREIAEEHNTIRVLDKENGGLSSARNFGFRHAKGVYVFFVDSDDSIEPNVLKGLIEKCEEEKLDILAFNYRHVDENGVYAVPSYQTRLTPDKLFTGIEYLLTNQYTVMVCMNFYRTAFLRSNNLQFMNYGHEDEEFTPRALYFCKRILYWDKHVYSYLQRGDSYTNTYSAKNAFEVLKVVESLKKFALSGVVKEKEVLKYIDFRINFLFSLTFERADGKLRIDMIKEIIRQGFWSKNDVEGVRQRYKTIIKHPRFSLFIFMFKYYLLKRK